MNTPSESIPRVVVTQTPSADLFDKTLQSFTSIPSGGADGTVFMPIEALSAGARAGNMMFQFMKITSLWMARGIIAPVEVVLRHQFGERYFNSVVNWAVVAVALYGLVLFGIPMGYVVTFLLVYNVLYGINRWACFFRDRRGEYWHSYFEGESWIRVEELDVFFAKYYFTFDVSKLFLEPLAVIIAGLTLAIVLPRAPIGGLGLRINPLGFYLIIAAPVLFFYQLYCYNVRRQAILDEKDAKIIAEARSLAQAPTVKPGVLQHRGVAFVSGMGHAIEHSLCCQQSLSGRT